MGKDTVLVRKADGNEKTMLLKVLTDPWILVNLKFWLILLSCIWKQHFIFQMMLRLSGDNWTNNVSNKVNSVCNHIKSRVWFGWIKGGPRWTMACNHLSFFNNKANPIIRIVLVFHNKAWSPFGIFFKSKKDGRSIQFNSESPKHMDTLVFEIIFR